MIEAHGSVVGRGGGDRPRRGGAGAREGVRFARDLPRRLGRRSDSRKRFARRARGVCRRHDAAGAQTAAAESRRPLERLGRRGARGGRKVSARGQRGRGGCRPAGRAGDEGGEGRPGGGEPGSSPFPVTARARVAERGKVLLASTGAFVNRAYGADGSRGAQGRGEPSGRTRVLSRLPPFSKPITAVLPARLGSGMVREARNARQLSSRIG